MKNQIIKTPVDPSVSDPAPDFKGYTIEELRYHRALVALQKEFCKSRVIHNVDKIKNHSIIGKGDKGISKMSRFGAVAGKLFSGLNYLDYAMIGMSVFGQGRKIYKFLKGKK